MFCFFSLSLSLSFFSCLLLLQFPIAAVVDMHFVVTQCSSAVAILFLPLPHHVLPGASVWPAVPVVTMSDEASAQVYVRDRVYCVSSLARRRTQRIAYCRLFVQLFSLLLFLCPPLMFCVQLLALCASFNPFDLGFKCKVLPIRCCRCARSKVCYELGNCCQAAVAR